MAQVEDEKKEKKMGGTVRATGPEVTKHKDSYQKPVSH